MAMAIHRRITASSNKNNSFKSVSFFFPQKKRASYTILFTPTFLALLFFISLLIFNTSSIKRPHEKIKKNVLMSATHDQMSYTPDPLLRENFTVVTDTQLPSRKVDDLINRVQKETPTVGSSVILSTQSQESAGLHPITIEMRKKLLLLPQPPWPQLDKRTPQAIADGFVLGVEEGLSYNNTIVTAYYEFESKHSTSQYLSWINNLLQTSDPMIIFVEPNSTWASLVKERRSHAPTIIAEQRFDDLVMSSTFTESFWQHQHTIDLEAKVHKGTGVYKIWNEKLVFLYSAIKLNPFDTPGFAWMDAGYFRNVHDAPQPSTAVIKLNLTEAGIPPEKVFVLHVRNDNLDAEGRVNIGGNAWYGTASSFLNLYSRYYTTFWDWISEGKFVGSDQFVMTETCRRYRSSCHPYFPGRFKDWFGLSKAVAGRGRDISKISPRFLFLDEPPENVAATPTEQKVTFCNNTLVMVDLNGTLEC